MLFCFAVVSLPHEGALTRLSINSNCESSKFKVCEVVICYGVIYFTPSRKFVKLICYGVIYFTSVRQTKDFHQTFGWVFTGCFNLCCDLDTAFKGMCYHVRAGTPRSEDCVWEASCEFGHGGCTGFTNNDPALTHWEPMLSSCMLPRNPDGTYAKNLNLSFLLVVFSKRGCIRHPVLPNLNVRNVLKVCAL